MHGIIVVVARRVLGYFAVRAVAALLAGVPFPGPVAHVEQHAVPVVTTRGVLVSAIVLSTARAASVLGAPVRAVTRVLARVETLVPRRNGATERGHDSPG